jgi:hypothetical protein
MNGMGINLARASGRFYARSMQHAIHGNFTLTAPDLHRVAIGFLRLIHENARHALARMGQ